MSRTSCFVRVSRLSLSDPLSVVRRVRLIIAEPLRNLEEHRTRLKAEGQRQAEAENTRVALEKAQHRRRVFGMIATAASVVLLVVSILAFPAVRAREDADLRRGQAENLIDFMVGDLSLLRPRSGRRPDPPAIRRFRGRVRPVPRPMSAIPRMPLSQPPGSPGVCDGKEICMKICGTFASTLRSPRPLLRRTRPTLNGRSSWDTPTATSERSWTRWEALRIRLRHHRSDRLGLRPR